MLIIWTNFSFQTYTITFTMILRIHLSMKFHNYSMIDNFIQLKPTAFETQTTSSDIEHFTLSRHASSDSTASYSRNSITFECKHSFVLLVCSTEFHFAGGYQTQAKWYLEINLHFQCSSFHSRKYEHIHTDTHRHMPWQWITNETPNVQWQTEKENEKEPCLIRIL